MQKHKIKYFSLTKVILELNIFVKISDITYNSQNKITVCTSGGYSRRN